MKTKQRTFEGNYSFSECKTFVENMMGIYDVRRIFYEEIKDKKNIYITKWRVIVSYYE